MHQKRYLTLLALVALIFVSVTAFAFWRDLQGQSISGNGTSQEEIHAATSVNEISPSQSSQLSTPTTSSLVMASNGWETFHGDVFSISFPTTWFSMSDPKVIISSKPPHDFYTVGDGAWFDAYYDNCTSSDASFTEEYYLEQTQLIKFVCKDDLRLTLSVSPSDPNMAADEGTLNQIADSVIVTPLSQWKTYQSKEYGVGLIYPPSWKMDDSLIQFSSPNSPRITQTSTRTAFMGSRSNISLSETSLLTLNDEIQGWNLPGDQEIPVSLGGKTKTLLYDSCSTGICDDFVYIPMPNSELLVLEHSSINGINFETDGLQEVDSNLVWQEILKNFEFLGN
jgi:hypothetical protein